MKNPPTLADAVVATGLDKKMAGGPNPNNVELRAYTVDVLHARKFVLDDAMSAYLADLGHSFWHGGLRKRICMLENARHMARLPHPITWIEFNYAAVIERSKTLGMKILRGPNMLPDESFPARAGWLLRQHPKIDTAFLATQAVTSMVMAGRAFIHPVSTAWCVDETPLPWRPIKLWKNDPGVEFIVMMKGYRSTQVAWTFSFSEQVSTPIMKAMGPWAIKPGMSLRDLWALLATINDLPIKIEKIEPSKGYIARGSYKKFLQHSVIHLTVPETRWRKLALKTAIALRRRAHQVRGHWRKDWRNPLNKLCEHEFDEHMICRCCRGHQIWIAEHQRGDASIGFVTHDYAVHHGDEA